MEELKPNITQTIQFLQYYFNAVPNTGLVAFTTINSTTVKNYFYPVTANPAQIATSLQEQSKQKNNVYIRTTPLIKMPSKGRGKKEDTLGTSLLWLDVDCYDLHLTQDEALTQVLKFKILPTIVINSGHGLHVWYRLNTFLTSIKAIESKNYWLATKFKVAGGDSCQDVTRILRVPGTTNWKNIQNPVPVSILYFNEKSIHSPDEFPNLQPKEKAIELDYALAPEPISKSFLEDLRHGNTGQKTLADRIETEESAIRAGATVYKSGEVDRSKNDAWISTKMLSNHFTAGQVLTVLTHKKWFSGSKTRTSGKYTYALYTIAAAKAYLEQNRKEDLNVYDMFFVQSPNGRFKFVSKLLADYLRKKHSIISIGEQFYIYEDGVYKKSTSSLLKREISDLLGEEWLMHREAEVLSFLRSQVAVDPASMQYSKYINVQNGLLDPKTGKLYPHTPEYKSIIQLPIYYDPNEDPAEVTKFVGSIVPADAIETFMEFLAFTLMPGYLYKKVMFLIGGTNTGKSTLLNFISKFLGEKNVSHASLRSLAQDKFSTALLYGRLANIYADLDALPLQSVAQIKSLTGGDSITAQHKFKSPFSFSNNAKLIFSANEFPAITSGDNAFYKRFLIIPCNHQFVFGTTADPFILEKYTTPRMLSATLNGVLKAYRTLKLRGGFDADIKSLRNGYDAFLTSTNSAYTFIATNTAASTSTVYTKMQLYDLYRAWCRSTGHSAMSLQKFYRELKPIEKIFNIGERYLEDTHKKQQWCIVGRRVLTAPTVNADNTITI